MKALSICSGIDAASVAWNSLPIDVVGLSEIDRFPSAVLAHHYPNRHNFGDFTKITKESLYEKTGQSTIDVLIGGTPCQSFSIAGLREGLDSENGNLALEYLRLANRLRPRWIVWENVPGVLSSVSHAAPDPSPPPPPMDMGLDGQTMETEQEYEAEEDHAFAYFLAGLSELGFGWAARTMDAQYFGVPQRRRRVFVVGHSSGDWRRAAAVLFEQKGLSRNPPPRRKEGERTAGTAENGAASGIEAAGFRGKSGASAGTIGYQVEKSPTLETGQPPHIIAFTQNTRDEVDTYERIKFREYKKSDVSGTLMAGEGGGGFGGNGNDSIVSYNIMRQNSGKDYKAKETDIAQNLTTNGNHPGNQGGTYICTTGQGFWTESDKSGTIRARDQESHEHLIFANGIQSQTAACLNAHGNRIDAESENFITNQSTIRRLTPIEAERLQGFPDNYTRIPYRGKPADQCPDGPRYKALGNSMAVPVIKWIGERIILVEDVLNG